MSESSPLRAALLGPGWPVRWLGGGFCLAGVVYLLLSLMRQRVESMDFRYVWLAGKLWGERQNPYGPAYLATGARWFPDGYAIAAWAYPFHWYPIARLFALAAPAPAFAAWLVMTTIALAAAFWLVIAAARRGGIRLAAGGLMLLVGYLAAGSIVGYALRAGQPAVLAACGVALCVFGMAREQRWAIVAGLVLAMLKPQLGLPFATALLVRRGGFVPAIAAAVAVLVLSIPAFLASGLTEQLRGLLVTGSGVYQQVNYNSAVMMSGLPHLVWLASGWKMSITLSMLLAAAVTAGLAAWSRARPATAVLLPPLLCVTTATLVGLHTYDLLVALFAIPFLPALRGWQRWVAIGGLALLWRTENLVGLATGSLALLPTVQTVALVALLAAFADGFRSAAQSPATSS